MAYDFTRGGPTSDIKATELVVSIFDQVDAAFYDALYPEILWKEILPQKSIKTDINPGAQNHVYRSRDIKGIGQFVRGNPANIPRVGQVVGQVIVPILDAAVGAIVTDAEARRYAYGYQSALAQDLGEVMRRASEYHIERTFFFGNDAAGFESFLDYSTVPSYSPVTAWTGADPSVWVEEVNNIITYLYTLSKTVHIPNQVLLPPLKYAMLLNAYVIGTGTTGVAVSALNYLKSNNMYTAITGKELEIKPLRYLESAGAGSTDRMIVRENLDRNQVMPFPLAFQLAQPVPAPLSVELFAEYVFGSYNLRYPYSMCYADGI